MVINLRYVNPRLTHESPRFETEQSFYATCSHTLLILLHCDFVSFRFSIFETIQGQPINQAVIF